MQQKRISKLYSYNNIFAAQNKHDPSTNKIITIHLSSQLPINKNEIKIHNVNRKSISLSVHIRTHKIFRFIVLKYIMPVLLALNGTIWAEHHSNTSGQRHI